MSKHDELVKKLRDRAKTIQQENRYMGGTANLLLEAASALSNNDSEQFAAVPKDSACNHKPGKFLGQTFSKNYERYACAVCGEEISVWIENR